nr:MULTISPECIES: hypothetical protein [Myxococcaceae]
MPAGRVLGVVLALAAAGLVLALWPSKEPGVPEAIERRVRELAHAAEEHDLGELNDGVSERFHSREGWGKDEVRRVFAAQVLRAEWLRVFVADLHAEEASPTRGTFRAKLLFARSEAKSLEGLSRDAVTSAYLIEGTFEREQDGTWRVVEARHRALGASELF